MNFRKKLKQIKAFVFDVDGVLGSDKVLLFPDGQMLRTMNIKDGYALQYAVRKGYKIAIITGGASEAVKQRFENLGINSVYILSKNKLQDYLHFLQQHGLTDEEVLYMGDDLPDYEVMKRVAIPTCPASAAEEIKAIATYISDKEGGDGAVRDVIQQVLKAQGKWMDADDWRW
ncbi:MAG TPA: HAD-IIIA family hydrolase [Bacteroidales bacterium]|mgnify:CR=1 FL=1|nr:HAD-IIIA family hydrolase [Bacteroidales bacterium]HOK97822.1 HAD-IIIA family hydrolase [Bacteroidales bacterium]HPO64562.1 HAD-IIIA family hydrolase [Bacteroidales bacterium]